MHGLLQCCACQSARQCAYTSVAGATCGSSVHGWQWAHDYVTPTHFVRHWLPVRQRITYKLCTMMHSVFLWTGTVVHCHFSYSSRRLYPLAFSTKWRLQHSTCSYWLRLEHLFYRWARCLEQSSSGDQMHRRAFHLQASSEGRAFLPSLRRFTFLTTRLPLTLNGLGFAFAVIHFYFAFTIFLFIFTLLSEAV